ncbi:hypothetical protein JWG40_15455 [Leptospira sp. 201903074]|uniref:hypothetical protein n=1 Tax=Leptospira abararensis TaxID=2810036 RepID=UPI001963389C|nr:hypothetical protein [Leptospira abararensis]MBM9548423.1 hypothetical protein [Leptospira abararensis]
MKDSTKTIPEIFNETIKSADKSLDYLPFSTDTTLQENILVELNQLIPWIKSAKLSLAQIGDGEKANEFLYLQSSIYSLISILKCLLNIKKNDFEKAWMDIIDAEEYIALGLRLTSDPEFLNHISKHREMLEKTMFPKIPIYSSIGAIVKGGKCNICLTNYENCNHIEGLIYKGQLCRIVDQTNIEINHTALVKNPRDRRCIPLKIENSNQKMENIFTKIESDLSEKDLKAKSHNGMLMEFIAFNNNRIDTD